MSLRTVTNLGVGLSERLLHCLLTIVRITRIGRLRRYRAVGEPRIVISSCFRTGQRAKQRLQWSSKQGASCERGHGGSRPRLSSGRRISAWLVPFTPASLI